MYLAHLKEALRTVIAIPVTPFAEGESSEEGVTPRADFVAYRRLVTRMVDGGIRVVTPNGNTSEFYSLTPNEQRAAVLAARSGVDAARRAAIVLAGVGFDAATAAQMARFAQEAGAEAVMVHQPVHPFLSAEGWIDYHRIIADAVPEMGVVPYVRDGSIDGQTLARLADLSPNFVGVKYAVANPIQFAGMVRIVGAERLAWICGLAESWAPFFWPGGAHGFTSGLVNITTALSLEMQRLLEAGAYGDAMEIWAQVRPFEDLRARRNNANNVSAVKEAMAQVGLCESTVRPPISRLPDAERSEVSRILATLGIERALALR